MELSNVTKVVVITYFGYPKRFENQINAYIRHGWKLLQMSQYGNGYMDERNGIDLHPVCVMGTDMAEPTEPVEDPVTKDWI